MAVVVQDPIRETRDNLAKAIVNEIVVLLGRRGITLIGDPKSQLTRLVSESLKVTLGEGDGGNE